MSDLTSRMYDGAGGGLRSNPGAHVETFFFHFFHSSLSPNPLITEQIEMKNSPGLNPRTIPDPHAEDKKNGGCSHNKARDVCVPHAVGPTRSANTTWGCFCGTCRAHTA